METSTTTSQPSASQVGSATAQVGLPAAQAGPKDVFLHLLAIVGLYASVGSFIGIVFGLINIYVPDIATGLSGYYYGDPSDSLRFPLAVLIVVFPLYALLMRMLNRDAEQSTEKRELRVRKWLFHFTLAAAAVLIAGDLIATIYQFLNGNLTLRFGLQVLTLFAVATSVFFYYYEKIRGSASGIPTWMAKWFVIKVSIIVALALGLGFYNAGTPQNQRLFTIDNTRVQHLSEIQSQVVSYWQLKQQLPDSIGALRNDLNNYVPPVDPETKTAYEYRATGDKSFELCATFALPSLPKEATPMMYPSLEVFTHPAGHFCFARTIDPQLFPPNVPMPLPVKR